MSRKTLTKEIDDLCRKIKVARSDDRCELCGCDGILEVHHIFGRGFAIRWVLEAMGLVCKKHHNGCRDHKDFYRGMFAGKRGLDWYDRMEEIARGTRQWKEWQLLELRDELREELREEA